ncbi:TraB/GumN family protein [Yoonia sp. R2331]|uniref:TraB/GumN family protein n=1 Tax=Yoonia sp. R2331 TaxID=3237238 RepID=UPI0034E45B18
MYRFLAAMMVALWPLQVAALCEGTDYVEALSAAERAGIDAVVADTPFATGLVWQATRDDKTLHVIGTMHIFDPRLGPIVLRTAPLVEAADLLLVEAGPEEETQMTSAMQRDPGLIFITDGPTLPEQLPEEAWQSLADAANARQIPAFMAAKMQPWYLAQALAIPACTMPDLASGARGLDHMLIDVALDANVPIAAVEDWDTLFTIMREGSTEEQLEMLQMGLVPPEVQTSLFVSMLNSYFAEDVVTIWEASRLSTKDIPAMDPARADALFADAEQKILLDRNLAWIPRIMTATAAHDRVVVAVGAAHLPGEQGVLNLLQSDGWTLTRLRAR